MLKPAVTIPVDETTSIYISTGLRETIVSLIGGDDGDRGEAVTLAAESDEAEALAAALRVLRLAVAALEAHMGM